MFRLDSYLIDHVFQPAADWLSCWISPRDLFGHLCLMGCALLMVPNIVTFSPIGMAAAFIAGCATWWVMVVWDEPKEGCAPDFRFQGLAIRLACWIYIVFDFSVFWPLGGLTFVNVTVSGATLAFQTGFYFNACVRNPPRKRLTTGAHAHA